MTEIARNLPSALYAVHRTVMSLILLTPSQGARDR